MKKRTSSTAAAIISAAASASSTVLYREKEKRRAESTISGARPMAVRIGLPLLLRESQALPEET